MKLRITGDCQAALQLTMTLHVMSGCITVEIIIITRTTTSVAKEKEEAVPFVFVVTVPLLFAVGPVPTTPLLKLKRFKRLGLLPFGWIYTFAFNKHNVWNKFWLNSEFNETIRYISSSSITSLSTTLHPSASLKKGSRVAWSGAAREDITSLEIKYTSKEHKWTQMK